MAGALEFHLTHVHENTHWFQHVGTTFGAFMDALRSSQRHTLARFLREEPRAKRADIVKARLDGGRPLIELDPATQFLKADGDDVNNNVVELKHIWFAHQWLHASFDDSRSTDGLGHPPTETCGQVMADVVLNCCEMFNFLSEDFRAAGHRGAREWYFAEDPSLSEVLVNLGDRRHHLTSIGLMECAASLNELQQLRYGVFPAVLSRQHYSAAAGAHVEAFLKSSYALPFKLFARAAPGHIDDWQVALVELNLIIYFSLNPPLPPRVLAMPRRSYRWFEIYPPHRFILALRALGKVRQLGDPDSAGAMYEFLAAIADESSLPYAGDALMPRRSPSVADWDSYADKDNHPWAIDDELIVQAQLHIERIPNRLALLANNSSCITGPLSREFARWLINFEAKFDFMSSPLEFLEHGEIGFAGSKAFGNNIVRSVASTQSLFELACGSGAMILDQFPEVVRDDQGMIEFMRRSLYRTIVETDNL
jgi:hypothetical protein